MTERSVTTETSHDTVVVRRTFEASAARVFAAWEDSAVLQRWCYPGDEQWESRLEENDFRVGGRKRSTFGPPGDEPYVENSCYLDIVPGRRLILTETIQQGDRRISTSQITVELAQSGARTELEVTDQIALLDGSDTGEARERGWGEVLERLVLEVTGSLA
jgi:uncharacterized protein YndB with AHSA1/START domain